MLALCYSQLDGPDSRGSLNDGIEAIERRVGDGSLNEDKDERIVLDVDVACWCNGAPGQSLRADVRSQRKGQTALPADSKRSIDGEAVFQPLRTQLRYWEQLVKLCGRHVEYGGPLRAKWYQSPPRIDAWLYLLKGGCSGVPGLMKSGQYHRHFLPAAAQKYKVR